MYERKLPQSGDTVDFGVSGLLYNNNLLMYDRQTETLWEQITGAAVRGELVGQELKRFPFHILTWGQWKAFYPESEVLSRLTGFQREYDFWPYQLYDTSDNVEWDINAENPQFHPKTRVIGVEHDGAFVAYLEQDVLAAGVFNDTISDLPIVIYANASSGSTVAVFARVIDGEELTYVVDSEGILRDQETWTIWSPTGFGLDGALEGSQLVQVESTRLFWFAWVAFHPETEVRRPL